MKRKTNLALCSSLALLAFSPILTGCGGVLESQKIILDPKAPASDNPTADPEQRLSRVYAYLQQNGYSYVAGTAMKENLEGSTIVSRSLETKTGNCYFVFGFSAGSALPDMKVLDPSGKVTGKSSKGEKVIWQRICAKQTGKHIVRLSGKKQDLKLALAFFESPSTESAPISEYLAKGKAKAAQEQGFKPQLEAIGYKEYEKPTEPKLNGKSNELASYQLAKGCYLVFVEGQFAPSFSIDSDITPTPVQPPSAGGLFGMPALRFCLDAQTSRVTIRASADQSKAKLHLYQWSRNRKGAFDLRDLGLLKSSEAIAVLSEQGFSADFSFTPQRGVLSSQGYEQAINLQANNCYAIVIIAEQGEGTLQAQLLSSGTVMSNSRDAGSYSLVTYCTVQSADMTVQIQGDNPATSIFLQVLKKPR